MCDGGLNHDWSVTRDTAPLVKSEEWLNAGTIGEPLHHVYGAGHTGVATHRRDVWYGPWVPVQSVASEEDHDA